MENDPATPSMPSPASSQLDPQRMLRDAAAAMERGNIDVAIRVLTDLIAVRPLASAYHLLIECYLRVNELNEAQTLVDLLRNRSVPYEYTLQAPDRLAALN